MSAVTAELARFACAIGRSDLPAAVRHESARALLNWAGCVLGGLPEGTAACAMKALGPYSGPAQATAIGFGRFDPFLAAMSNSIASAVNSFNDTHFTTVAHPTSPVAAAIIALAELRPVDGPSAMLALTLGNELQCRIGLMLVEPPAMCGDGLSMQGLAGTIGAAIAAGRVIGLDAEAMERCIGLAANQVCGLREAHASMASAFTPGNAARAGIMSALLAESGYGCSPAMLEGAKGFAVSYASHPVPDAAVRELGSRWEFLANAYKPYPSGFVIHPATDAAIDLAREPGHQISRIREIVIRVNPLTVALCDRPNPAGRRQAIVSVQHWIAAALTHGRAGLQEGSDAVVRDPAIQALRARIRIEPSERIGREACELLLHLDDGTVRSRAVNDCRGSIGRPMTDQELIEKFRGQAELLLDPVDIDVLERRCLAPQDEPAIGELAQFMHAAVMRAGRLPQALQAAARES
jgi:2-methylcitrate dehydratase PrpD